MTFLRPLLGYISLGLAGLCLIFFLLWKAEVRHADKLEARNAALVAELQRISTKKDEQKRETAKNIDAAKERIVTIEKEVTKLENRPVPADSCVTPDLQEWRKVL